MYVRTRVLLRTCDDAERGPISRPFAGGRTLKKTCLADHFDPKDPYVCNTLELWCSAGQSPRFGPTDSKLGRSKAVKTSFNSQCHGHTRSRQITVIQQHLLLPRLLDPTLCTYRSTDRVEELRSRASRASQVDTRLAVMSVRVRSPPSRSRSDGMHHGPSP